MINHPNRSKVRKRITLELSRSEYAEIQAGLARLSVAVHQTGPAFRLARIQQLGQRLTKEWDAAYNLEIQP